MFCNSVISRPVIWTNETNRGVYLLLQQRSCVSAEASWSTLAVLWKFTKIDVEQMERWWAWLVEAGNQPWLAHIDDQALDLLKTWWLVILHCNMLGTSTNIIFSFIFNLFSAVFHLLWNRKRHSWQSCLSAWPPHRSLVSASVIIVQWHGNNRKIAITDIYYIK